MKFSIRDLLLVTVIVAILLAWWIDRSRLAQEVKRLTRKPSVMEEILESLPNSSAPAPNPPKK